MMNRTRELAGRARNHARTMSLVATIVAIGCGDSKTHEPNPRPGGTTTTFEYPLSPDDPRAQPDFDPADYPAEPSPPSKRPYPATQEQLAREGLTTIDLVSPQNRAAPDSAAGGAASTTTTPKVGAPEANAPVVPAPSGGGSTGTAEAAHITLDTSVAMTAQPSAGMGGNGSTDRVVLSATSGAALAAPQEASSEGSRGLIEEYLAASASLRESSLHEESRSGIGTIQQAVRIQKQDVTEWPRRAVVNEFHVWPDDTTGRCSGLLIGRRTVLIAAHCINRGGYNGYSVKSVRVVPGMDRWYMPYGQSFGARLKISDEWMRTQNDDFDWALIILDRNIGDVPGWFGYWAPSDSSLSGRLLMEYDSYPANTGGGLSPIWSNGFVDCYDNSMVYHSAETSDGSSGGGIHPSEGTYKDYAFAVNTGSDWNIGCIDPRARSTRINTNRKAWIDSVRDDPTTPPIVNDFTGWSSDFGFVTARPTAVAPHKLYSGTWNYFVRTSSAAFYVPPSRLYTPIGGNILGPVAATVRSSDVVDLFVRDNPGSDYAASRLCTKTHNGDGTWSPSVTGWQCFSDTMITDAPSAVASMTNRVHAFGRSSNGSVIEKSWLSGWTSAVSMGGNTRHQIATVCRADYWWDIFIRDADTGQICTKSRHDSTYWPSPLTWFCMGNGSMIATAPTVASSDKNRLDVIGVTSAGNVIQMFWRGGAWQGPVDLGGAVVGPVAIVSRGFNQIDLFAVGADGAIWTKANDGNNWWPGTTAWFSLGGNAMLDVEAVSYSSARLDVFARGRDMAVWQRYWDGTWH
jgi:V8-like Glu-specific endopeptidase